MGIKIPRKKEENATFVKKYAPPERLLTSLGISVTCKEQRRLLDLYKTAVASYCAAVNDTAVTRGRLTIDDFDRLLARTKDAEHIVDRAREALDKHKAEHGCYTSPNP